MVSLKKYNKDSIIYLEYTRPLPYLFIVKAGRVQKLSKIVNNEEIEILKEGDTFGFVNCLTGQNYLERITTLTDTEIILVAKDNIIPFFLQKKDIFLKLIKEYSNKLRNLDEVLKKLTMKSPVIDAAGLILQAAEYFTKIKMEEQMIYSFKKYIKYSDNLDKVERIKNKFGIEKDDTPTIDNEKKIIYRKDNIIFLEQEEGNSFFFIEKGKVKISHIYKERELILAILSDGEVFGEMAILNRTYRMASAICFEDCSLLVLNKDNFIDQLSDRILQKIFISISKRIYHTQRRVINLNYTRPISRIYDCLDYLIASNYGIKRESSFHFYFSIDELKRMIDMPDATEKELQEFYEDYNIKKSYGEIIILDLEKFYDKLRKFTAYEKNAAV